MRTLLKRIKKPIFIDLRHITYSVSAEPILNNLNLHIEPGTVHALVGKHGGGKSTLCKIISGLITPTSGAIAIDGKFQYSWSFARSRRHGIVYIHQYFHLLDHLSVMENFLVTRRSIADLFYINRKKLQRDVQQILDNSGFDISVNTEVRDLPKSKSVAMSVILQLALNPRLLILDEILDRLDPDDQTKIIAMLDKHKERGLSVLWITHNIDEVGNLADMISVFRKGTIIFTNPANTIDKRNLIKLSYNQISRDTATDKDISDFYNLLRYNEAILLHLPVNLLVLDPKRNIKLINHRGRRFFSVESEEGYNLDSLLGEENSPLTERIDNAVKERKEITFYELPLRIGEHHLEVNLMIYPIIDDADYIGCILIIEDVTEKEYLRKQAILSERLSSVGLMAAGVAHEINNPLEVISNNLNYLRFDDVTIEEKEEVLSELEDEVIHIKRILKNIFLLSDRQQMEQSNFDLSRLIARLLNLLKHNASTQSINIIFKQEDEPVFINANLTEIREVIINLVKNSLDALEDGGEISIMLEKNEEEGTVRIIHRDNGSGIDEFLLPDIFLPFSTTKHDKESNMGLGLSIVYNIIQKHAGKITVENIPEGGCQFIIILPLNEKRHPQPKDEITDPNATTAKT